MKWKGHLRYVQCIQCCNVKQSLSNEVGKDERKKMFISVPFMSADAIQCTVVVAGFSSGATSSSSSRSEVTSALRLAQFLLALIVISHKSFSKSLICFNKSCFSVESEPFLSSSNVIDFSRLVSLPLIFSLLRAADSRFFCLRRSSFVEDPPAEELLILPSDCMLHGEKLPVSLNSVMPKTSLQFVMRRAWLNDG